ncbi:MAG: type II toxin-antitoxin system HicB family antitoxin [bacterium]|nr:type II toxin-antitoxin system HicB family antitoxin [bacterium]
MMEYKRYVAAVEYDDEAGILHGEVINTRAVITFQATSTDQLRREMEASIEDYLDWCAERGKEPEKPYSGRLVLRTTAELHRAVVAAAAREDQSVDSWITKALERAVELPAGTSHGATGGPAPMR